MKILITGVAGFIGSSLADRLLKDSHEIIGLDNFDGFYARSIKEANIREANSNLNFKFVYGDITDWQAIDYIFSSNKIDVVIHLAAKAGVRSSINDPTGHFRANVNGTLNILEAMHKYGVNKLLHASSSSVYGNNIKIPFAESDPVDNPISPYAASKKASELICHTYHHLYGMDIFCLRFFTVYGPRQRPDLAINKFTDKILHHQPIEMYGDGSTARDYTFIEDILDGICLAIDKVKGYEIINLGESNTITLSKMISVIEEKLNTKAILNRMPMQAGDVNYTNADITKAKNILGYNPKWKFENGIEKFVKWKLNE